MGELHDDAVEVATDEVAENNGGIEKGEFTGMVRKAIEGHAHVIKSIGDAMRETAGDEEGDTKEQWQVLTLAGKGDSGGHDKTTTYGKQTSTYRSHGQSCLEDALRCLLKRHG